MDSPQGPVAPEPPTSDPMNLRRWGRRELIFLAIVVIAVIAALAASRHPTRLRPPSGAPVGSVPGMRSQPVAPAVPPAPAAP